MNLKQMLKDANLYCTKSRVAILQTLSNSDKPLSQEQISQQLPNKRGFDKVTIYRTLESFCKAGLVHKAFTQGRTGYFELAHNCSENQCHPHFTCNECGQTQCLIEISPPPIKGLKKGFAIHRQQTHLQGLCPQCNLLGNDK